jgi:hypothetical protein
MLTVASHVDYLSLFLGAPFSQPPHARALTGLNRPGERHAGARGADPPLDTVRGTQVTGSLASHAWKGAA